METACMHNYENGNCNMLTYEKKIASMHNCENRNSKYA